MEAQVFIRFEARDIVAADWVDTMLGDDPPIFEDELPEVYRYLFEVLEDLRTPEGFKRSAKYRFDLSFVMGGSWEENLRSIVKLLSAISDKPIFVYYWMDELEGFLVSTKEQKLTNIDNWAEDIKQQGIKKSVTSDSWIYKYFNFLAKR